MPRISLVNGHPDAVRLCAALTDAHAAGDHQGGHELRFDARQVASM